MPVDYFEAKLALDTTSGSVVPGAVAQVFAVADTSFTSPLPIYDLTDTPMSTLTASPTGIYPAFRCPGHQQVVARAGGMLTPLTSLVGALLSVIPNPSTVTDTLALVAEAGEYRLVPRSESEGLPPDPSLAPDGAGLVVKNGVMQWLMQAAGIANAPSAWPSAFPPIQHTHGAGDITDATALGRAVLSAATAQAARQAIGAGTGNGTSNLTLGATSSTAAPGDHSHQASAIPFTPAGPITAQNLQDAVVQAASMGGSGGGTSQVQVLRYAAGQYPAFPATKPTGVVMFSLIGPVVPTSGNVVGGIPSYVGNGATQIPAEYRVNTSLA